jgi:hypothetical protein
MIPMSAGMPMLAPPPSPNLESSFT